MKLSTGGVIMKLLWLLCGCASAWAFSPRIDLTTHQRQRTVRSLKVEDTLELRPGDGSNFECVIPDVSSICLDGEQCDVAAETTTMFQDWLKTDGMEIPMGTRIFQYSAETDKVSVTVTDANGQFHTLVWPWQDVFMELWARDLVCSD